MAYGPVRMLKDGTWADVDLQPNAGGAVTPRAHPEGLRPAGKGGVATASVEAAAAAPQLDRASENGAPMVPPVRIPEGMSAKVSSGGGVDFLDGAGEKVAMEVTQSGGTVQLSLRPDTASP